jgi:uncharacterized protein YqeY
MTSLLQQIKDRSLEARKAKTPEAIYLTTLLGEASRPGKDNGNRESTDEEVLKVLTKFKTGAIEMLDVFERVEDVDKIIVTKRELAILDSYLPKLMSNIELENIIAKFVIDADKKPSIGMVMAYLKANYTGQYDGKAASVFAKTAIEEL